MVNGDRLCPILVESPLLAVYPSFDPDPNTTQPRWRFAGFAVQKIQLGIEGSPAPTTEAGVWRKIWLNQLQFLNLEDWQVPYGLVFKVPYWFKNWRIFVWEYRGFLPTPMTLENWQVQQQILTQQLLQQQQSNQTQLMQKLQALELTLMEVQNLVEIIETRNKKSRFS